MLFFFLKETFRDKKWEICIAMPGRFEPSIEFPLNIFPYFITLRFETDAASYSRITHQICFFYNIQIPSGKILSLRGNFLYKSLLLRHIHSSNSAIIL